MVIFFLMLLISAPLAAYEKPSKLGTEVWQEALPHLFPEDHPQNGALKALTKKRRLTHSPDALKKLGFTHIKLQPFTKMTTAIHKDLPGLFFKIYLDPQKPYKRKPEHFHWLCRIRGANMIRDLIAKKGWEDSFKVPKKWMFPLPSNPKPSTLYKGVFFILVEEDMELVSGERSLEMWKSDLVTPKFLDRLLTILTKIGLADCTTPKNLPFSKDGRIAFIDTQTSMSFPIRTNGLTSYLSKEMGVYWEKICKEKS